MSVRFELIDLLSEINVKSIDADVVVVGAGPAGISLALAFAGKNFQVALLEAGGMSADSQALYAGITEVNGPKGERLHEDPAYLMTSRARCFGGTSTMWSNWCRPLDQIDFTKRDWIPESGWPISRKDLEPFYPRAYELCGVPPVADGEPESRYNIGNGQIFRTIPYHIGLPRIGFGQQYGKELAAASNIKIYLNAPVVSLHNGSRGAPLSHVLVQPLGRPPVRVNARVFILAGGGVVNPQILLHSEAEKTLHLGDEKELIGRYFTEDFHFEVAEAYFRNFPKRLIDQYNTLTEQRRVLVYGLTEAAQREHKLLNLQFDIDPFPDGRAYSEDLLAKDLLPPSQVGSGYHCKIRFILAQAPNIKSRVVLLKTKDKLGVRQVKLQMAFSGLEFDSMQRTLDLLVRETGMTGSGRIRTPIDSKVLRSGKFFQQGFRYYGYHHMGTTRMSEGPESGVVDKNCRMHSVENLYLAGSSVFGSMGHSPPTLNLVGLALRLADHVEEKWRIQ